MPHKGILQLIYAFATLVRQNSELRLLLLTSLYPKPDVQQYYKHCRTALAKLKLESNVYMITDFLPADEVRNLLAGARLVVYPYQNTSESSSAAVRYGLASGSPVAVTPLPIFDDVAEAVYHLPGTSPENLAQGIDEILVNEHRKNAVTHRQNQWLDAHGWPTVAKKLYAVIVETDRTSRSSLMQHYDNLNSA